jgi:type IV secretion system protein VirD4
MGALKTFISKLFGKSAWAFNIDESTSPVAVLAPPRSGTSTCVFVPSLLSWRGSAVVFDRFGEMYELTEHWRRIGALNKVWRLDFFGEGGSANFNFLDAIPWGAACELDEIRALAADLIHPGADRGNKKYGEQAQSLLTLFIIAQRRSDETASLHDVQKAINDDAAFHSTLAALHHLAPSDDLKHAAKDCAEQEEHRDAARMIVSHALSIFAEPVVAHNTRRSTFHLAELLNSADPLSIYLTLKPWNIEAGQPLIRAFLGQLVRMAMQRKQQDANLLLALEHFDELGRLECLETSLAEMPSCGIKPLLSISNLNALKEVYGEDNKIWQRCATRIVLSPNRLETAEAISKEIDGILAQSGQTRDGVGISPGELMFLNQLEAIILGAAPKPVRATMLPYYESAVFKARVEAGRKAQIGDSASVNDREFVTTKA